MDAFWKWLIRANARAVLGAALLALLAVTAWWVWRELAPPVDYTPAGVPRAPAPDLPEVGILARIEREADRASESPEVSPFVDRGRRVERPRPPRRDPPRRPRPPPDDEGPDDEGPYVEPPPRRVTVTLEFRGLYQGSDGRVLALIHDRRAGAARFRAIGDTLHGFTLEAIDLAAATLRSPDGARVPLPIRVPQTIDMPAEGGSP